MAKTGTSVVALLLALVLAACSGEVYVRDGVTDGDRFSLPPHVYVDDDPVLQAWVAYGIARSICQLEMGGPNPARNHSFGCELTAREALVSRWIELRGPSDDVDGAEYLDLLTDAARAGLLGDYTWHYLRRRGWTPPPSLDEGAFEAWSDARLPRGHRPRTRIVGSWGYALSAD